MFTKTKTKTLVPLLTDEHIDAKLKHYKRGDLSVAKGAAVMVRKYYEAKRNDGTLVAHNKVMSYRVNLETNKVTHECCGAEWDANRWSVAFIPPNWRPGRPILCEFCPTCGARRKPADEAEQPSTHLASMLEAEPTGGGMRIVKGEA